MTDERCELCRFWKPTAEPHGQCRRYSPQAKYGSEWPVTLNTDWCGEFETDLSYIVCIYTCLHEGDLVSASANDCETVIGANTKEAVGALVLNNQEKFNVEVK